jgi:transposase
MSGDVVVVEAEARPRGGRPSKFTHEVREKVLSALRGGNYLETAAAYAGISVSTLHKYLAEGRQPGAEPDYANFAASVDEAIATAEVTEVAMIRRAASPQTQVVRDSDGSVVRDGEGKPMIEVVHRGNWQAAAWILERRDPGRWGRVDRSQVEVSGPNGGPVQLEHGIGGSVAADVARITDLQRSLQGRRADEDDVIDAELVD